MAVHYTQALLDRATAYLARTVSERRYDEGLAEIARLLSDITGEPTGGCRQCQYSDYFARLRAYLTQAKRILHPETVSTSPHTLKPEYANETFVHENYGKPVLGSDMTDEDAVFFAKHYPHAFSAKGKATPAVATSEKPTEVTPDKPLVPQADLETEQTAHEVTKKALAEEKEQGKKALKAEKEAHKATHKQLTDTQKVLADTEKQLTDLREQVAKAADTAETEAK